MKYEYNMPIKDVFRLLHEKRVTCRGALELINGKAAIKELIRLFQEGLIPWEYYYEPKLKRGK